MQEFLFQTVDAGVLSIRQSDAGVLSIGQWMQETLY